MRVCYCSLVRFDSGTRSRENILRPTGSINRFGLLLCWHRLAASPLAHRRGDSGSDRILQAVRWLLSGDHLCRSFHSGLRLRSFVTLHLNLDAETGRNSHCQAYRHQTNSDKQSSSISEHWPRIEPSQLEMIADVFFCCCCCYRSSSKRYFSPEINEQHNLQGTTDEDFLLSLSLSAASFDILAVQDKDS